MSSASEFNCVFCNEVFTDKETFQTHFRNHGDPNFSHNKNKGNLENEILSAVEKKKEDNEMVTCDACDEVFSTISKAITHKHKVHPDLDAKYFCPWCGKLFTLKHLYNKHLQINHESKTLEGIKDFHCDSCDVEFYLASAMLHHNKFFHRQDTELPTLGQSKKQKMFHDELLTLYYCSFCGEEFNNKVNLFKHMTDEHCDENQSPDEILRCPLCDAIFYHLDAYEVHLMFHSSEDIYTVMDERKDVHITEYTLETVPPMPERVEDLEPKENEEAAMGIESLLQMSMDTDNQDKKRKKHKKHKKSKKKETITLDEFLNMNSDVFGEDLNVHGIEEVPTRVVTKHLKKRNQAVHSLMKPASVDIAKLKNQGIVVKRSGGKVPIFNKPTAVVKSSVNQNFKKIIPQVTASNSNDVLNKLISQTNSQIKIVKRPVLDTSEVKNCDYTEDKNKKDEESYDKQMKNQDKYSENKDNLQGTPSILSEINKNTYKGHENTEPVLDGSSNKIDNLTQSDNDTNNKLDNSSEQTVQKIEEDNLKNNSKSLQSLHKNQNMTVKLALTQPRENKNDDDFADPSSCKDQIKTFCVSGGDKNIIKDTTILSQPKSNTSESSSLNMLRNLGHLTIKSLKPKNETQALQPDILIKDHFENQTSSTDFTNSFKEEQITAPPSQLSPTSLFKKPLPKSQSARSRNNNSNKSFDTLKHLSNKITVKPVAPHNPSQVSDDDSFDDDSFDDDNLDDGNYHNLDPKDTDETDPVHKHSKQNNSNNALHAVKHLSNIMTVKPVEKQIKSEGNDDESFEEDENHHECHDPDFKDIDKNDIKIYKQGKDNLSNSLDAVKHLSNIITVKPVEKQIQSEDSGDESFEEDENDQECHDPDSKDIDEEDVNIHKQGNNSLDAIKHLSNIITVKSVGQKFQSEISNEDDNFHDHDIDEKDVKTQKQEFLKNNGNNVQADNIMSFPVHEPIQKKIEKQNVEKLSSSVEILKHLKNVTAKPLSSNINTAPNNLDNTNSNKGATFKPKKIEDEMEIFNIDDSDSNDEEFDAPLNEIVSKQTVSTKKFEEKTMISNNDTFKKVNENIIKSMSTKSVEQFKTESYKAVDGKKQTNVKYGSCSKQTVNKVTSNSQKLVNEVNEKLQSVLKNLGSNMSISRNSSPLLSKSQDVDLQDEYQQLNDDSASDTEAQNDKVKITELKDSDEEIRNNDNVIIEYPNNTDSEEEELDHYNSDFEDSIKTNVLNRPQEKKDHISNLKYQNNKIVNEPENETQPQSPSKKIDTDIFNNISKELTIKSLKPANPANLHVINKTDQSFKQSSTQSCISQQAKSANQVSTVNKEVSVKTFESQTVIEEVTTTVTKTIRTVNQTVNQQFQNTQAVSRPQKTNTNVKIKNFPMSPPVRLPVRAQHAIRSAAPFVRGPVPPRRPALTAQAHVFRHNAPKMLAAKPNVPSTRQPRPTMGKPLKISPNVIASSMKRQSTDDSGHFSCFKKPKESLIPVTATIVPTFNNEERLDSTVQYASTSQMSKSFSSATKTVKGNSLSQTSQIKCEMKRNFNKIQNSSGLKTVQQQQNFKQFEQKSESVSNKTLQAIEMLRKQGLLVKKPRVDVNNDSEHSHDSDNDEELSNDEQ